MTRRRIDQHGTEFGEWVRRQPILAGRHGYLATNLDYIWGNYEKQKWMLIEEKRWMSELRPAQWDMIELVHHCCKSNEANWEKYQGFHLLQFERTNPDDGRIFWDKQEISKQQLIRLLSFEEAL